MKEPAVAFEKGDSSVSSVFLYNSQMKMDVAAVLGSYENGQDISKRQEESRATLIGTLSSVTASDWLRIFTTVSEGMNPDKFGKTPSPVAEYTPTIAASFSYRERPSRAHALHKFIPSFFLF